MCGIVGMASLSGTTNWLSKETWFSKALFVDTLRGDHSTGIFCVPSTSLNEEPIIYKKALAGPDFLELEKTKELIMDIDKYSFIVGHNRKATQGGKTAANAHPFQHKHITLVHNGTLVSRNGVAGSAVTPVDSKAICHAMAEKGSEDLLPKLDGAYALVWYDSINCTLNLARNDERPLHFAFSEDGNNMFFASEPWMIKEFISEVFKVKTVYSLKPGIHMIIDSMSVTLKEYSTKSFSIFEEKIDYWSEWEQGVTNHSTGERKGKIKRLKEQAKRLEQLGYTYGQAIIFKFKMFNTYNKNKGMGNMFGVLDMFGYPPDSVQAYNVSSMLVQGKDLADKKFIGVARDTYFCGSGKGVTLTLENVKEYVPLKNVEPEDVDLEEGEEVTVTGPDNKEINLEEFDKLTMRGCAYCTADIHMEDADDIEWTMDNQPICYDCQEHMTA